MQRYYIKTKRHATTAMVVSSVLLILSFLAFIFPSADSKDSASAYTGLSELSTAEISVVTGHENATVRIGVRDLDGTFATSTDDESAKFTVSTNNFTGYTLGITSDNNDGDLVNPSTTDVFNSINSEISQSDFDNSSYNGKWGFRPSKYNSAANTNYLPSPTTTPTILDVTTVANNTHPTEYSIGIGARAGYSLASGVYSGTFIINVTTNPASYVVTYGDNSGDSQVRNLPDPQSGATDTNKIILTTNTPTRPNHTFVSWCLGTVGNNGTSCNGTTFEPGGEFVLDETTGNEVTLYAVWSPNIAVRIAEGISNINLGGTDCNISVDPQASVIGCIVTGLNYGQTYTLVATIDGGHRFIGWNPGSYGTIADTTAISTTFTVGAGPTTITPTTDSNEYTIDLVNSNATTAGSTSTTATYRSAVLPAITNPQRSYTVSGFSTEYNDASGATVSSTETLTNSYPFEGWYNNEAGDDMVITSAGELVPNTDYTDAFGKWNVTSRATLYSIWGAGIPVTLPTIVKSGYTCGWTTETATSTILYASGYAGFVPAENTTLYGVCVVNGHDVTVNFAGGGVSSVTFTADGWPTVVVSTSGGAADLVRGVEYTVTMEIANGYNFGSWSINDPEYGIIGAPYSNPTTFEPNENSASAVITATTVAVDITGLTYMQEVTPEIINRTANDTIKTLRDNRDNTDYTVRKINGVLWMTKNLALNVGDATLRSNMNSTNTNVADGWKESNYTWNSLTNGSSETVARYFSTTNYGYIYNYAAATAGTITGSNANDAVYDICPRGWRLPNRDELNDVKNYKNAFSGEKSGIYTRSTDQGGWVYLYRNQAGYYYSSTAASTTSRYWLTWNGSNLNVSTNTKYDGISVRCVGINDEEDIYADMQDVTATMANNITGSVTMRDKRDNNTYKVTKINGQLWMTQNLRFLGTTLDPTTSNVATNTTLNWKSSTTADSTTAPYYYDSGSKTRGVWYNYYGATAGSVRSGKTDARYDICPAGWRLPTRTEYSGITSQKTLFDPVNGGTWDATGDTINKNPGGGDWWSSTAYSSSETYMLRYENGNLSMINQTRYDLRYLRCIWSGINNIANISTLQQFNGLSTDEKTNVMNSMAANTNYTLVDTRDNQTYTIAKLADGKVWMTQNLNLGATNIAADLTSADTNIATSIPAATFNGWRKTANGQTYTAGEFATITTANSEDHLDTDPATGTKYGTLYNYYAATGSTIKGTSVSTNATYDICPAGWRLPTGGSGGEFENLYSQSAYNSLEKMRAPISSGGAAFAYAGINDTNGASIKGQGVMGSYWASTYNSMLGSVLFDALAIGEHRSPDVDVDSFGYRWYWVSIRCVLK